ncbi:hypothetical protein P9139_18680 [Curtobacterium flaccumfaciens]|nr:hypothetical protein P9139_18680 [Curtobacterium flaccumfaciens]
MMDARPAPPAAVRGVPLPGVRLQGVDVARAVALLGMMATHVGGSRTRSTGRTRAPGQRSPTAVRRRSSPCSPVCRSA